MKCKILLLRSKLSPLSCHLVDMLDGAFAPLSNANNRMRFAQAAYTLRELLRELLSHFAPDAQIKNACWFISDPTSKTGVTRKHRTTFAVYCFVNPSILTKSLSEEVEGVASNIVSQVGLLSQYTHTTVNVLTMPESASMALLNSTLDLFSDLLKAITTGKEILVDELQMALTTHLDDIFINEFFDELDILSTHTRPTGAWDVEVEIADIDEENILFTGTGSVSCDLQYGSDAECRREGDVGFEKCFPFSFEGSASVTDLKTEVDLGTVSVDTSSYYE